RFRACRVCSDARRCYPIKAAEERPHRANQELQMHAGRLEQEVQHRMAKVDEALYELERLGYSIVHV
ncbi:MAG TPA: hypothetical protein VNZ22_20860, partial [Bacillota bacterium]|nr:hypothetical protein [Bacillota bacterium]